MREEIGRLQATPKPAVVAPPSPPFEAQLSAVEREIDAALVALNAQYPDFQKQLPAIRQLADAFKVGEGAKLTVKDYLEGLYVISKFASFAKAKPVEISTQ